MDFILKKAAGPRGEASQTQASTLHRFSTETRRLSDALWKSRPIPFRSARLQELGWHDEPVAVIDSSRGLYVGTVTGAIEHVGERLSRLERFNPLRNDEQTNEIACGARAIRGFVEQKGQVYDASFAGIHNTWSGTRVSEYIATNIIAFGDTIGATMAPYRLVDPARDFSDRLHDGSWSISNLTDPFTRETLSPSVAPTDGSGGKQGTFLIAADEVFMNHGNYPYQRITRRPLHEMVEDTFVHVYDSHNFLVHEGVVYDIRTLPKDSNRYRTALIRSDTEDDAITIFENGERISSAVSAGEAGILYTVHDSRRSRTAIRSHLSNDTIFETDGVFDFMSSRYRN